MKLESIPGALTGAEFDTQMRTAMDTRRAIVEGLLYEKTITMLSGEPGDGKSTIMSQMAVEIAGGHPVFGKFKVTRPHKVGFLVNERSRLEFLERAYRFSNHMTISAENIFLVDSYKVLNMLKDDHVELLLQCLRRDMPGVEVVFFDPIYPMVSGGLSKDEPASSFCRAMTLVQAFTGASLWYNHHNVKASHAVDGTEIQKKHKFYGSQWLMAHVTGAYALERKDGDSVLVRKKDNYNLLEERVELEYNPETDISTVSLSQLPSIDRFKMYLRSRAKDEKTFTFKEIQKSVQLSTATIRKLMLDSSISEHLIVVSTHKNKNLYKSTLA